MATHKLLASGQLQDSAGVIYDVTESKRGMVKAIVLHNNRAGSTVAEVFYDATAEANRLLKVTLAENETFEWSLGHMIVLLDSVTLQDKLQGVADYTNEVTYHIFGAEEDE
jgi:hypothetical protein